MKLKDICTVFMLVCGINLGYHISLQLAKTYLRYINFKTNQNNFISKNTDSLIFKFE
jgi:hypothetical protein